MAETVTKYLHLGLGSDAIENANWERLDQKAFDLARQLIADIPAGGDLQGFYPDPQIAPGAVGPDEISSVPWSKITGVPPVTPSGPAGGVLSGTYPDPGFRNEAVDSSAIADGAITFSKLGPGSVNFLS